jgi:hypothetical protein
MLNWQLVAALHQARVSLASWALVRGCTQHSTTRDLVAALTHAPPASLIFCYRRDSNILLQPTARLETQLTLKRFWLPKLATGLGALIAVGAAGRAAAELTEPPAKKTTHLHFRRGWQRVTTGFRTARQITPARRPRYSSPGGHLSFAFFYTLWVVDACSALQARGKLRTQ